MVKDLPAKQKLPSLPNVETMGLKIHHSSQRSRRLFCLHSKHRQQSCAAVRVRRQQAAATNISPSTLLSSSLMGPTVLSLGKFLTSVLKPFLFHRRIPLPFYCWKLKFKMAIYHQVAQATPAQSHLQRKTAQTLSPVN